MKYSIYLVFISLIMSAGVGAQQAPDKRAIRIVDSLTAQEKNNRNPLILRAEFDSMLRHHTDSIAKLQPALPVKEKEETSPDYLLLAVIGALALIALLLYVLFRNQKKFQHTIASLNRQIQQLEFNAIQPDGKAAVATGTTKGKQTVPALEKKLAAVSAELEKTSSAKSVLEQQLEKTAAAVKEYELVKQQMTQVYKMRNYPGFAKEKSETAIVEGLLETEKNIALYAYEQFLKPVIAVADANRNDPARIRPEEQQKILDGLLSLSLFYSEYLYLRVNELTIGGRMVERIGGFKNGGGIDKSLLKELNLEHGSRALVIRMALEKAGITSLSYPVFDETNLNLS